MASQVRENYHEESEAAVNKQINMELYAFYTYTSLGFYFDRDDIAMSGFKDFFLKSADEEYDHAKKFMAFQNERGGRIVLQDVKKPAKDEWGSGAEAMQAALQLEKDVNQALLDMHKISDSHGDAQMCDFIEANYLTEQTQAIKQLGDYVTQLKKVGTGHGEWHFQKDLA
nr:ferritin 2 [Halisarca dujardinii]